MSVCWQDKIDGTLYGINKTFVMFSDITIPVLSTKVPGAKAPDFSKVFDNGAGSQGIYTYLFSSSSEEEIYGSMQMPHSWKLGTDIQAHVHWYPMANGGAGEDVSWGLEYNWTNVHDIGGNTTIIYGDINNLSETLVQDKQYITEIGTIDGTSITLSAMVLFRLFRDATGTGGTDDYPNDAALLQIDFHFEIDSLGSRERYLKE